MHGSSIRRSLGPGKLAFRRPLASSKANRVLGVEGRPCTSLRTSEAPGVEVPRLDQGGEAVGCVAAAHRGELGVTLARRVHVLHMKHRLTGANERRQLGALVVAQAL